MTHLQPQDTHTVLEDDTSFSGRSSNPYVHVAHEVVDADPAIVNHTTTADDVDAAPRTATTDADDDDDDGANGLFTNVPTLQATLETRKLRHRMSLAAAGRLLWIKRETHTTTSHLADPSPLLDSSSSDHTTTNSHTDLQCRSSSQRFHSCLFPCGTLSSYLQCLLICCLTAVLSGAVYFVYGSRALSDPTNSEPWLQWFIVLPINLIRMDWVCMCVPWIMARTFAVNEEQQEQQRQTGERGEEQQPVRDTWRQCAWSWITFSPRSMRSAIGLLIFLFVTTRFIPGWIRVSWYMLGDGQSLHSYRPWTLYRDVSNTVVTSSWTLHYTIILPYIFTSKHSVCRQRTSTCTNLSAPFFDRVMGTPYSFFARYSYVTLFVFNVSDLVAKIWYKDEWGEYHYSFVMPIIWISQSVVLIIEYIATSSRDHLYINHPGYIFGLTLWFQYFPVVVGWFFLLYLAPAYHDESAAEVEKVGLYFAMVTILTIGQYLVRILASRAVSPRLALLFVFGCQVFEDAISDMAFLQLEPFNLTFFLIAMLHVVKTIFRDLDLIVNVILTLRRLLQRAKHNIAAAFSLINSADLTSELLAPTYSDKLYATDVRFLYQWHQRFDRFFLRHQNFISELSCKAVVLCYLLADYLVHNYASHDSLASWSETITVAYSDDDRWTLILEMLVLTIVLVITHFVVLRLLSRIEDQEEKSIEQILSVSSSEITSNDHGHMDSNSSNNTPNATESTVPRSVELQSVLQLSSAIREQIIQEQTKCFYGNENDDEKEGNNISPTNGGLSSDDGNSLSTQDALRWICHDAWASQRVRFMLVVAVYYFIYIACGDAHSAAVSKLYP